jgi:DNA-binding IclR family transcriptional regulator
MADELRNRVRGRLAASPAGLAGSELADELRWPYADLLTELKEMADAGLIQLDGLDSSRWHLTRKGSLMEEKDDA